MGYKKGKYGGGGTGGYKSQRSVSGPGVFVTCDRGKEARCVADVYDLLQETAARLYPAPIGIKNEEQEIEEELCIEDAIAKELEALSIERKGKGKGKEQNHRFINVDTDTECLLFMAFAKEYDPVEMVHSIVRTVIETRSLASRYILRIEPVSATCHALTSSDVEKTILAVVSKAFSEFAIANSTNTISYQIEPSVRQHLAPLIRPVLLDLVGTAIRSLSEPSESSLQAPIQVRADLKAPDLVVLPSVLRNLFGISVVDGKIWHAKEGKRFNLSTIACNKEVIAT